MAKEGEADRRPIAAAAGSVGTITPSDVTVLSPICHKIFAPAATGGQVIKLRLLDGSTPTMTLAAGPFTLDVQFDQVMAATTATVFGFYPLPG